MEHEPFGQQRERSPGTPELMQSPEAARISDGIAEALREGRAIDHETAWLIVRTITPGSGALHQLAMTGEITPDIGGELEVAYEVLPGLADTWIAALDGYCFRRQDKGSVPGWSQEPESERSHFDDEVAQNDLRAESMHPADDQVRQIEPVRHNRLVGPEERLAPLPELGDIPRPGSGPTFGSGYEWMERLSLGWHVEPSWGRDGWDLGAWPLIVVALFVDEERGRYAVATYTEGDVTVSRYQSRGALYVAVNEIAEFHWRLGQSLGPDDLPAGAGLLAKHCKPYSQERYAREMAAEHTSRNDASSGANRDESEDAGKP